MAWTSDKLTPYPGQKENSSKLSHDISMNSARNHLTNATATTLIALSYSLGATNVGSPTTGKEIPPAKAKNLSLHSYRRNPTNVTTSNHQRAYNQKDGELCVERKRTSKQALVHSLKSFIHSPSHSLTHSLMRTWKAERLSLTLLEVATEVVLAKATVGAAVEAAAAARAAIAGAGGATGRGAGKECESD